MCSKFLKMYLNIFKYLDFKNVMRLWKKKLIKAMIKKLMLFSYNDS